MFIEDICCQSNPRKPYLNNGGQNVRLEGFLLVLGQEVCHKLSMHAPTKLHRLIRYVEKHIMYLGFFH